jgi:hypothetical protein
VVPEERMPESGPGQEALDAVSQIVDGVREKKERVESRQIEKEERQQKKAFYRLAYIWVGVLAILAVNVFLFLQTPQMSTVEIPPSQELEAFALIVNDSLRDYAMANDGVYPESLQDLTGEFLQDDPALLNALQQLDYRRPASNTFILSLSQEGEGSVEPLLVITEIGVQP